MLSLFWRPLLAVVCYWLASFCSLALRMRSCLGALLCLLLLSSAGARAQTNSQWRAIDVAVGGGGTPRVLWTHPDGRMSVWTIASGTAGEVESAGVEGPISGWSASALSVGANGNSYVLWNHTDGRFSLHIMGPTGTLVQTQNYGPVSDGGGLDWRAVALAAGSDNRIRVLLRRTDGKIAVWMISATLGYESTVFFGPYTGWTAERLAVEGNNAARIQWRHTDGRLRYWSLEADFSSFTQNDYGPDAGWTPYTLGLGGDGTGWIGWKSTSNTVRVWKMGATGTFVNNTSFGSYTAYEPSDLTVMSDGSLRALWQNDNGAATLWRTSATAQYQSTSIYNTAPTNLTATSKPGQVELSWNAAGNADGYAVYRSTSSSGPFTLLASPTTPSHVDRNVSVGAVTYYYYVVSVTGGVSSATTVTVSGAPTAFSTTPAAPTNLSASEGGGQVSLSWTASSGPRATSYKVAYRALGTSTFTEISGISGTTYTVTSLTNGTDYELKVAAVNSVGAGSYSSEVYATPGPPTAAPTNLTYAPSGGVDYTLSWDAVSRASSYRVEFATVPNDNTAPGTFTLLGTTPDLSYPLSGLNPTTRYYFRVMGVNPAGTGPSYQINFKTTVKTPTLSVMSAPGVKLSWTASSGATQYSIYRAAYPNYAGSSPTPILVSGSATTYTDTSAVVGQAYNYVIKAMNSNDSFSELSNQVTARVIEKVPNPPTDLDLSLNPVYGGDTSTGMVILERYAGVGGETVQLSSNSASAVLPTSIVISQGYNTGTFSINTNLVTALTQVQITATNDGVSKAASLTIRPADLRSVNTPLGTIIGGSTFTGSVVLNSLAPQGGFPVTLTSSHAAVSVPASVTVPAGKNSVSFPVVTATVTAMTDVTVTGTANGVSKDSKFTLWKPMVSSVWRVGNPIACGGIRWPSPNRVLVANTSYYLSAFEATDFDQRDIGVDGNTATITHVLRDTCTYTWIITGPNSPNVIQTLTGRNVRWQSPATSGSYDIKLIVDDQNDANKPGQEGNTRDDAAQVFTVTVTVP